VVRSCSLPALLARLRHLLQSGTPAVSCLRAARRWAQLESRAVARGMWRALLHAGAPPGPQRATWARQQRSVRRQDAGFRRRGDRAGQPDHALFRKFRVQSHYLLHRGFVRPGGLDRAVQALALAGVPVDWVHGRLDAVCPPRNSERWFALGHRTAPGSVTLSLICAGHLGHEPATLAALQKLVRRT
jgi:proline iminopeptidase